jgi:hypothetical protein
MWKYLSGCVKLCLEKGQSDWILHHDNAPAHKVLSVKQFRAQKIDYWNETPNLLHWFRFE